MKFFNALSIKYKILIALGIIFILWLLWRKFGYKFQQLVQARKVDLLPGESSTISSEKKSDIETIGSALKNDIDDTPITGHNYTPYEDALKLTQNELNYLADYYKKYLGNGVTLWSDIDSQWYTTSGTPSKLQVRLDAIGKK